MHPTVKPVAMLTEAIRDVTRRGAVVLDPFAGSGSTLIAAEKTGRQARCIEYEPRYCDVIVRRWQAYTGKMATFEGTDLTFEDFEGARSAPTALFHQFGVTAMTEKPRKLHDPTDMSHPDYDSAKDPLSPFYKGDEADAEGNPDPSADDTYKVGPGFPAEAIHLEEGLPHTQSEGTTQESPHDEAGRQEGLRGCDCRKGRGHR